MWKTLAHPNIAPILGTTVGPPQLIADWTPDEDLTEYIANHPDAIRRRLVCTTSAVLRNIYLLFCQLSDVANGLSYLHSCDVIHGGLKGVRCFARSRFITVLMHNQSSILVDTTGRARITDFGLATVTQNLDSIRSAPADYGRSIRWIAPEILDGQETHSKEADVFSFAMVVIEVRCR